MVSIYQFPSRPVRRKPTGRFIFLFHFFTPFHIKTACRFRADFKKNVRISKEKYQLFELTKVLINCLKSALILGFRTL